MIFQWATVLLKTVCVQSPHSLLIYMVREAMSVFHQTFLEDVWPIGVVWNGSLITIEITDSTVCPHYDRQKLKCIKHCNPSSCRWGAGASEFRSTDYPLLNKGWSPDSSVLSWLLTTSLHLRWMSVISEGESLLRASNSNIVTFKVLRFILNQNCFLNSFLQLQD